MSPTPDRNAPAPTSSGPDPRARSASGSENTETDALATNIGRAGLSRSATIPPSTEPPPNALTIAPQVAAPPMREWATTGPRTPQAANTKFPTAAPPTKLQTHVRARKARHPSRRSRENDSWEKSAAAGMSRLRSSRALAPNVAASKASAEPAPNAAISPPATAGPTTCPAAKARPRRAFACWMRSPATTDGSSPVDAGLKKPVAAPVTPASAASSPTVPLPVRINAANPPWLQTRTRSAVAMIIRRGTRSARTPPTRMQSTRASIRAAKTIPMSDAEPPRLMTANAVATLTIPSPRNEMACAPKRRRKRRSCRSD